MKEKYIQYFKEEYAKLNTPQQKAVNTTEGALLVVAGPGTGKTQILAARIANILQKTDAKPQNILCLTFTDAGVVAMRNRLEQFIGTDAYKVNIHTFHSFCNKVIQENASYFSVKELEPIGDLERIQLMEKLVDGFDVNHPLKRMRGDVYYDISSGRLNNLFSLMKRENFTAAQIEKSIESYIEDLPNREGFFYKRKYKEFNAGDPKPKAIEAEKEKMELTLAAAKELETYQQLKAEKGYYDFDDMILWVLKAFKEDEDMLLNYQERFQYVLVDEYQDTNGAQNDIFKLLISYWENPNAFVVGDDDQSIYRFQGANLSNIIDFYNSVICKSLTDISKRKERVIVMDKNYRSTQDILDLSKQSIENNNERLINQLQDLNLSKDLKASHPDRQHANFKPKIVEYYNQTQELLDIAKQIETLHEQKVDLNEIAVIYKEHKQTEELLHYLNQKNIPVRTKRKVNILDATFTNKIIDILTYVYEESRIAFSREDLLFKILHFDFFDIDPLQIARLAYEYRNLRYENPRPTWRQVLRNIRVKIDESSISKIEQLATTGEKWQKDLQSLPIQLFFQTLLEDLKLLPYIVNHKEKIWLLQELKTFFDFIKAENQRNPKLTLKEFLETIETMRNYKISLDFVRSTYAESAVNFTTAHGSKGLQFKYVFLLGLNKATWDSKRRNSGFTLPDTLLQKLDKESELEEDRRLFYVALTRAQEFLQVSYAAAKDNDKEMEASQFVSEIKENNLAEFKYSNQKNNDVIDFQIQQFKLPPVANPRLIEEHFLAERMNHYKMSVTHLNNYLKCPLTFYYVNFLQIPSAKNAAMAFGSSIHGALEDFFRQMQQSGSFSNAEELVNLAERRLFGQEDSFSEKDYQRRLEYLKLFLPQYYETYINIWSKDVRLEKSISAVYNNITLTGIIDKVEQNSNGVMIVDYKTGQFTNAKKKFTPPTLEIKEGKEPSFEDKYGGDYWRQAVFYKLLLDNSNDLNQRQWNYIGTEFDFVEPDAKTGEFHKQKVIIRPTDIQNIKTQVSETYQNIKDFKFDGCGEEDCEWCNFQREIQEVDIV